MSPPADFSAPDDASNQAPAPATGYEFSPQLVTLFGEPAKQVATLRQTAAEVLAQHLGRGRRGLAVCSASLGAGVSFIAANLAIVMAQSGVSTLLVDAHLERPGLPGLIRSPEAGPGLSDLLASDEVDFGDVLHEDVLPRLSLVYAGQGAAEPHELLGNARFDRFIDRCLRSYECVLVDAPPANLSADARRVATVIGYALIVARRNVTYAEDLVTLRRELEQDGVAIVGSILNAA